jgi:hypothetical protein
VSGRDINYILLKEFYITSWCSNRNALNFYSESIGFESQQDYLDTVSRIPAWCPATPGTLPSPV